MVKISLGFLYSSIWFIEMLFILFADIYNKYDTVMYPPLPTKSYMEMMKFWKTSPVDFKPMETVQMRQECLHHYLEPFATKICSGELLPNYSIASFSKQILDIYSQMCQLNTLRFTVYRGVKRPDVAKVIK